MITQRKNAVLECLRFEEKELALLSLLYGESYTEEEVKRLFEGLDLDSESTGCLIALEELGRKHSWAFFPESARERISDLLWTHQIANSIVEKEAADFLRPVVASGTRVMLVKGMSMRMHYWPGSTREMADTDCMVCGKDYERLMSFLKKNGYHFEDGGHSLDIHLKISCIDVHPGFLKSGTPDMERLWNDAPDCDLEGVRVKVPSREDAALLCLVNQYGNLFVGDSLNKKLNWIMDFKALSEGLDWEKFCALTLEAHLACEVLLMCNALNAALPGLIPAGVPERLEEGKRLCGGDNEYFVLTDRLEDIRDLQRRNPSLWMRIRYFFPKMLLRYKTKKIGCPGYGPSLLSFFFEYVSDGMKKI